jgi:hypothetical protein
LLKCLDLASCYCITKGGFVNAIKKFPLLEDLVLFQYLNDEDVLEMAAKACPCLKSFSLVQPRCRRPCYHVMPHNDDQKAFAIAKMKGLRSLSLVGHHLGNQGLAAIIDNCRQLEYLNVRDCCNITMDCNLTAMCARIIVDYYEYIPPSRSCSRSVSPISWITDYDDYDPDDYNDLSLYSYLGDEIDGANFEEHERILDVKSMRRYLS